MVMPHPLLSVVLSHYYTPLPSTVALHLGNAICLPYGTMAMFQPMLTVALPHVPPSLIDITVLLCPQVLPGYGSPWLWFSLAMVS